MLEFEAFAQTVLRRLDVSYSGPLRPDSGLFDDIGLDSVLGLELLLIIEMEAGLSLPPVDLPEVYTLGEAYAYYEEACAMAGEYA